MKTVHRYVLSAFLSTFVLALVVLTFVLSIGLVFGAMKYIARGMSAAMLLRFLWRSLPGTLSYSVPIASLISSLLVFSRLSSDSEISAMRSCGIPLSAVMRTPILLSALLSVGCWFVNNEVTPDANYSRAVNRTSFRGNDVTALLEEGSWISVGDYDLFVSSRDGNELSDLRVLQPMKNGKMREYRARTATIRSEEDAPSFLEMHDVTIDPWQENEPVKMSAGYCELPLAMLTRDGQERQKATTPRRRIKDLRTWELVRDLSIPPPPGGFPHDEAIARSRAKTELASRFTLAVACFCFVLVGIPLGIQSHRRESSAGLVLALVVAGLFYFFCITGESLAKHPAFQAHWIVLLPIPVCLVLAHVVLHRQN